MKPDDLRVYDFQNEEQPELLEDEMKTLNELEFEDGRKLLVESKYIEKKKKKKSAPSWARTNNLSVNSRTR